MAKITLDSVISGFKSVTRLVSNFSKIEDSLNNDVLWRDNPEGEPNQMEDDLDMNTNRITNLPSPVNDTDAVRWVDVKDGVTGVNEVVPSQSGNEKVALTTNGTSLVFGAVDSDNVDFLQAGTGAVATDVQSKLRNIVSVKDFSSVEEAVAYCYTNTLGLYWPEVETVVVNIPNLHDVRNFGPGGVTRGSNTWYVEQSPNQENRTLYVSSVSGSNTNDGLDTTYPVQYEPYALTAMLTINPNNDEQGFITLKSDHVIVDASMMTVSKVNAGWVVVTGDGVFGESGWTYSSNYPLTGWTYNAGNDTAVPCSCTASTASRYMVGVECNMPECRVFVDGNAQLDRLYSISRSTGKVAPTYGGKNFRNDVSASRPLYCNTGTMSAQQTVWENFHSSVYFARGASANIGGSLFKDSDNASNGALVASRAATIAGTEVELHNCTIAVEAKRCASLNLLDVMIDDTDDVAILCSRDAHISADGAVITNCHNEGVNLNRAGNISLGYGTAQFVTISASGTVTGTESGIKASSASTVSAPNITISGGFEDAILAQQVSTVDASQATISGAVRNNVYALSGSRVNVNDASVTGATNLDLVVNTGASIYADDCTTTGSVGTPLLADTNAGTFNTISANGMIFD